MSLYSGERAVKDMRVGVPFLNQVGSSSAYSNSLPSTNNTLSDNSRDENNKV
jgi:hypothetical protein